MKFVGWMALLAAAALAGPAAATDPSELSCPLESLAAADRASVTAAVSRRAEAGDPAYGPLAEALQRCRARLGWPEELLQWAGMHALAAIGEVELRQRLVTVHGLDADAIDRAIAADRALIEAVRNQRPLEAHAEALVRRLGPAFVARIEGPNASAAAAVDLGWYVGFRATREASRLVFRER